MKIEKSFRDAHDSLFEAYTELQNDVDTLFESARQVRKEWHFTSRLKEQESYVLKVLTGRCSGYIIDDFYACTVIVPNLVFVDDARKFVEKNFVIVDVKPGDEVRSRPTEFNFDGLRYTCKLKSGVKEKPIDKLEFEVQIKTFLEHAWAVATHEFSYKGDNISWAKERLSAQIKAVLDNADLTIFEADSLSESKFLKKKNLKYEKISEVIQFLKNNFGNNSDIAAPSDFKRLAGEIHNLLFRLNIDLDELKDALADETDQGRGYKTKNLSIYSIVLTSICTQLPAKSKKGFLTKNKRALPIVVPAELEIDADILAGKLINVTLLVENQSQLKKIVNSS